MICTNCQHTNRAGAKFCDECGTLARLWQSQGKTAEAY